MKHISGHYTPKSGKAVSFDVQIPETWAELNIYQTAALLEVLTHSRLDLSLKGAIFLAILFGKDVHIVYNLPDEELLSLAPLTNFILETDPEAVNPLPEITIAEKPCIAAAADLSNIGFGEWCFAYQVYHFYCSAKDEKLLDQLIAILYRPAAPDMHPEHIDFTGDLRLRFNENHIPARAQAAAALEPIIKHTVLAWFASALFNVMKNRPHLFPQKTEDELLPPPDQDDHRTWFTVFRELLGPKWGTEAQLKFTNAMFVLDALEEQQIDGQKPPQ